jgi:hypothetical protein
VTNTLIRTAKWVAAVLALGLAPAPFAAVLGWHDGTSTTAARGWSCDTANYSRTVTVYVGSLKTDAIRVKNAASNGATLHVAYG